MPQQNIPNVSGKRIREEIDGIPLNPGTLRTNPVLVRQGKAKALFKQQLGKGDLEFFQGLADAVPAGRDGPAAPPGI